MDWPKLLAGLAVLVVIGLAVGGIVGLPTALSEVRALAGLGVALALVVLLGAGGIVFRRTGSNPYW